MLLFKRYFWSQLMSLWCLLVGRKQNVVSMACVQLGCVRRGTKNELICRNRRLISARAIHGRAELERCSLVSVIGASCSHRKTHVCSGSSRWRHVCKWHIQCAPLAQDNDCEELLARLALLLMPCENSALTLSCGELWDEMRGWCRVHMKIPTLVSLSFVPTRDVWIKCLCIVVPTELFPESRAHQFARHRYVSSWFFLLDWRPPETMLQK